MNTGESQSQQWAGLVPVVAGRTPDEQIEYIRKNEGHGIIQVLRSFVLQGAGIPKPKEKAENAIIFGCYLPFLTSLLLRDYISLLDRLGVDYTYLEKEFCCGFITIVTSQGAEAEKAREAGRQFMQINRDAAERKGAKTLAYWCHWCAHLAKSFFPGEADRHVHYPDLLIDRLERETLSVAPAVVGYYEGCHRRNQTFAPGVSLDWGKYRQVLDRIDGLKVVDLSHSVCCLDNPEPIVAAAEAKSLDTIVTSCITCHVAVGAAAAGRVQMKYLPELLLQALAVK
jgi:Fe-S oxidoreductase